MLSSNKPRIEQVATTHGAQKIFRGLAEMGLLGSPAIKHLRRRRQLDKLQVSYQYP